MTLSNRLTARVGLIAAIIVGCGMFLVAPASAHTRLLSSDPAENAQVVSLPQVTLRFSESVQRIGITVRVLDSAGTAHQTGAPQVAGFMVTQGVTAGLTPGAYRTVYRVVASDGHVATGEVPFTITGAIDEAAAQAPGTPAATAGQPSKNGSSRWVMVFSGLFIGIGIGGAMVFMRNRRPR
jgi:methionine-rich copper-binding protein CopC